jgi:hypothetical protein
MRGTGNPSTADTGTRTIRQPSSVVSSSASPGARRAMIVTSWPRSTIDPAMRCDLESNAPLVGRTMQSRWRTTMA